MPEFHTIFECARGGGRFLIALARIISRGTFTPAHQLVYAGAFSFPVLADPTNMSTISVGGRTARELEA
ncbi:hypothetical protein VTO73DRAFT_9789 [Trametes versicolor]